MYQQRKWKKSGEMCAFDPRKMFYDVGEIKTKRQFHIVIMFEFLIEISFRATRVFYGFVTI